MPRLLFIAHRIPYPPNKGDKIRSFHFLKHLATKYQIDLACLADDIRDLDVAVHLQAYTHRLQVKPVKPLYKKMAACVELVRSRPLTVSFFYSLSLQKTIDSWLSELQYDVIYCSSSPTAEYIFRSLHRKEIMRDCVLLMDFMDVDSMKWNEYSSHSSWPMRHIYALEAQRLANYEQKIIQSFDKILLVSENEKNILKKYKLDISNVVPIANGVDVEKFAPAPVVNKNTCKHSLVFTGAMDYQPNIDGILWFADNILPRIQEVLPDTELTVVGSNPVREIKRLGQRKRITVTGFVQDVRPYMLKADVCVIPLLLARGIQNKVLEAMALALPVVATPQALEGISACAGKHIMVAEEPDHFAQEVIALLRDKHLSSSLGVNARKFVKKNYTWQKAYRALDAILASGTPL